MRLVENQAGFDQAITSGVVLVDFYADWCGPCRAIAPAMATLSNEIPVIKVDIDKTPELAKKFNVSAIPTLVFFKEGKEEDRIVGLTTLSALRETAERLKD
jgi:thioredoxin 1